MKNRCQGKPYISKSVQQSSRTVAQSYGSPVVQQPSCMAVQSYSSPVVWQSSCMVVQSHWHVICTTKRQRYSYSTQLSDLLYFQIIILYLIILYLMFRERKIKSKSAFMHKIFTKTTTESILMKISAFFILPLICVHQQRSAGAYMRECERKSTGE